MRCFHRRNFAGRILGDPPGRTYRAAACSVELRMSTRALITGITGQDGAYLARLLARQGLRSPRHGAPQRAPRTSSGSPRFATSCTCTRPTCSTSFPSCGWSTKSHPHEVYNLAAQSFVPTSLAQAAADRRVHGPGRDAGCWKRCGSSIPSIRFYQAQQQRNVRQRAGGAAERETRRSTPAALTAWRRPTAIGSR